MVDFRENPLNAVCQPRVAKLNGRYVHGDSELGPGERILAGAPQHPFTHFDNEPGPFGDWHEYRWRHIVHAASPPARQSFDAKHLRAGAIHKRLVLDIELPTLDREVEILLETVRRHIQRRRGRASLDRLLPNVFFACFPG